jgi:hypothetical protein
MHCQVQVTKIEQITKSNFHISNKEYLISNKEYVNW